MNRDKTLEQHIAVFGESGSGKTVLLSSFYGATQEHHVQSERLFRVVADDTGQGFLLLQNYLGMEKEGRLPDANRFAATQFSFSIALKNPPGSKPKRKQPNTALRLVWHDYPGEWFEQGVSGTVEAQRRVDTFRSLLSSDVALLLVDAQRLLEYQGREEVYLKSLFWNFSQGLLSLKEDLLDNGEPLVEFPRIWVMALSKADLVPEFTVADFKDLMILKAAEEINQFNKVLTEFVQGGDALSVSEDFLLLSSAKFDDDKIDVGKRVGLDQLLPLAAILPFDRHIRWAKAKNLPKKVLASLMGPGTKGFIAFAYILLPRKKIPGPIGAIQAMLAPLVANGLLEEVVKLAGERLQEIYDDAKARQDYLAATLAGFKLDLERGEKNQVLLRSQR